MLVTYIIATHNRKDALKRHLDLLLEQTWPEWFEVIICDDGSTDGTHEFLAQLQNTAKYTVQWFETGSIDKNTAARSRNNGIRAAQGEMIIFADDDCLPHCQLIESFANNFKPQEVQLGYKSSFEIYLAMVLPVPIEEGTMETYWRDWQAGKFGHFQTGICAMSNTAARTPAKDGSLGLDERFIGYGHEDTEFGLRLHKAGYRLVFNPNAVIWHMNPEVCPQQNLEAKKAERIINERLLQQILQEGQSYLGNDIPGWMGKEELSWLYKKTLAMKSIVEIGPWQGRSTHALLSGCQGAVVVVDKWDKEQMSPYGDAISARKAFFANVKGFQNITVMEMDSLKAATAFQDRSVDMIFIDADHSYEAVKADILAWRPKVKKLLCGHDYGCGWPGVDQAVKEIIGDKAKVFGGIWFAEVDA